MSYNMHGSTTKAGCSHQGLVGIFLFYLTLFLFWGLEVAFTPRVIRGIFILFNSFFNLGVKMTKI